MKKIIAFSIMICLIISLFVGCSEKPPVADSVVYGTIYTAEDENNSLAEAFAIKDGKYLYVGDKEGAEKYIKKDKTEIIDRTGEGLIIPGCTEGHGHYITGLGMNSQLPGSGKSYEEVLAELEKQVKEKDIRQFVSFGWPTYELAEKRASGYNFAEEIEKIAPGVIVVLIDNSGHNAVCNNTAITKSHLWRDPVVRGGEVDLDSEGKPTGYLADQAVYYVLDNTLIKVMNDEQYKNACVYGMNKLLELGYTNALEGFLNMYDDSHLQGTLKQMDDAGELKVNIAGCYHIKSFQTIQTAVDNAVGNAKKNTSKHFNPSYIKLFADGVVEAGTGWISDEYINAEKGKEHGNIIWSQEELNYVVRYANSKGLLVHTHAYGDAACKSVLDAYIASNKANGKEYRNSLAHVRNIQKEDIVRAADNKIAIAENLLWHMDYDETKPEQMEEKQYILGYVPEDVYNDGYPMKSLMDNGVIVSSSTDAPAAQYVEGSIMNVLEVAVTGIMPGESAKPFREDELLTVREGLKALTINGAWQLGLEKERGSIKAGKYADFVILDKNVLDYKGEQLRTIGDTKILSTYFEGEKVYSAQ